MDYVKLALAGGHVVSSIVSALSKYEEGKQGAKTDTYRASLAQENAKRADFLHLEREERARKEGILDAGLFQMRSEMSGLSGVSADMWIGQRFMDVHKDVNRERVSRQQTVNRFLKESRWHRDNANANEINKRWGIGASLLTGAVNAFDAYGGKK